MENHKINIRLRLIIIKNEKLLTSYTKKHDFYFYIGGHMELGETVKKVLYIRDFFDPDNGEQNVELFILGDINKFEELEGKLDPQHKDGSMCLTWLDINNLPVNLYPKSLSIKLLKDHKNGFPNSGEYVGRMDS
jgi:hypothetical protein